MQGFDNEQENAPILGGQKIPVIKNFLKKRWTKLGIWYRLGTFNLGMALAMLIIGGVVRERAHFRIIFLVAMVSAILSIGKILKEIYLMDEAQNYISTVYMDFGPIEKKRLSALLFGKSLSLVGNWVGCFAAVFLVPTKDLADRINATVMSLFLEMISAILLTSWIAFVIIAFQQILAKCYVKKHKNKSRNMAESLEEEALGNLDRAKEIRESRRVPRSFGMQIGYATLAICVLGNFLIIPPLLPKMEKKEVLIAENESDKKSEVEEELNDSNSVEDTGNIVVGENVEDEEDYNPNGYGFSIGQDCLNVYLDYVKYAEGDYEIAERENGGDYEYHRLAYFSIAGMAGDEPFLLLSSIDGNRCGDETYFVTYTPYDYSGEGIEQTHMQGNFEFGSCDFYSMRQTDVINTIYVWASNPKTGGRFIHREDTLYFVDYDDSSQDVWDYSGDEVYCNEKGKIRYSGRSDNPQFFEEKLASGELMEIKWFSIDQIEEAREYYQQYVREEVYDGPVETANRDDYYNENTVLKYFDYISDGVFTVTKDEDGDEEYTFSCLDADYAYDIAGKDVDNALKFTASSDSQTVWYFLIENADGSRTYIKGHIGRDEHGYALTYSYDTNEEEVVFWFNHSSEGWAYMTWAVTVDEVIERLKTGPEF